MTNVKNAYTVTWSGSATSLEVPILSNGSPMALVLPASFGATSITFTASITPGGTHYPVKKEDNTSITVTVDSTNSGWYDLTNIFPASVRYVKLVASTSITKTGYLVARDVS